MFAANAVKLKKICSISNVITTITTWTLPVTYVYCFKTKNSERVTDLRIVILSDVQCTCTYVMPFL